MNKKAPFLILVLLTSYFQIIPISWGATDEGYGEDETCLGQFVDSFENYNNISVIDDLIVNTTLDYVELEYDLNIAKDYENFTDYTLVDTNNKLDIINDYKIDFIQLRRDDEGYVYYDYGANYWDDFQLEFSIKINDTEAGDVDNRWICSTVCITSYTNDYGGKGAGADGIYVWIRDDANNDDKFKISIYGLENGVPIGEDIGKIRNVSNDELYLRYNRTDDDIYLWVYTDLAFSVLDESLNLLNTGLTEPLRYIYGIQTVDGANDGNIWMSGHVKNLWLGNYTIGYETDGYFTTDDYLNDTSCNGTSLCLMLNSTIPGGTGIQVQFSNDNVTWRDWEGIPLDSNILDGGFESIDLRYLNYTDIYFRYNFTSDGLDTPRLYQSRLISTIGVGAVVGPSGSGGIGVIMLILICAPIIIIELVWRARKR